MVVHTRSALLSKQTRRYACAHKPTLQNAYAVGYTRREAHLHYVRSTKAVATICAQPYGDVLNAYVHLAKRLTERNSSESIGGVRKVVLGGDRRLIGWQAGERVENHWDVCLDEAMECEV